MKRLLFLGAVLFLALTTVAFDRDTYNPNLMGGTITLRPVALASATGALALPPGSFFQLSGALTITSITTSAADNGRIVIFLTAAAAVFSDGNNLKLTDDFTGSADDILVLIGDGVSWYELCRSHN